MRARRIVLIAALSVLPVRVATAQCVQPTEPGVDPFIPDQAMVRVAEYSNIQTFLELLVSHNPAWYANTSVNGAIESRQIYRLQLGLPPGVTECDVRDDLRLHFENENPKIPDPSRPLVWVEKNWIAQADEGKTGSIYVSRPATAAVQYHSQYAMSTLGLGQAHQLSTGRGIVVAVVDTGIDATHPELQGRILTSRGFNFINNTTDTRDIGGGQIVGHGTFVAGLITLTAPDARILPVVVLDNEIDGIGDTLQIAGGMFYAIDQGAEVINMSLGSTYDMKAVEDALEEAMNLGIVVTGAAGNFDRSTFPVYPASFVERDPPLPDIKLAFGVAAVDANDVKAAFSNYNEFLTISAPGTSVGFPLDPDPNWSVYGPIPDELFGIWEGTSFSTAWVSGAAALVRAQLSPLQWGRDQVTWTEMRSRIESTAVDISAQNPLLWPQLGAGRLDIAAAASLGDPQFPAGDLNYDRAVDLADLGILLADFGCVGVRCAGDIDRSGGTDLADLGILLANFGL